MVDVVMIMMVLNVTKKISLNVVRLFFLQLRGRSEIHQILRLVAQGVKIAFKRPSTQSECACF